MEARIRTTETDLHVGAVKFSFDELKMWKTWSMVEAACRGLPDPKVTAAELEVISSAAAHLGAGARNGLTELKSALASTSKA